MLIRADLHTHALGEGRLGPESKPLIERHVQAAIEAGIQCLAVTDHDDVRPSLIAEEYAAKQNLPILIVPGLEITTNESHLVALGIRAAVAGWQPLTDTIGEAKAVGALVVLPHPAFAHLRERTDVDAMERYNSRYGDFPVESSSVPLVANSDAHSAREITSSRCYTLIEAESLRWSDIAAAIRQNKTQPALTAP
jgi:predicted metal-dependent phosphoesterase TrpH